jgi:hypothetical protein
VEKQLIPIYVRSRKNPEEVGSAPSVVQTFTTGRSCVESVTRMEVFIMFIDDTGEEVLGIGLADKVSMLEKKPVLRLPNQKYRESEEYLKYVFTPEMESKAVDELTHWRRFKERVDRAYRYATGERLLEIDDEKKKSRNPVSIITYIIVGISMITGAALIVINRMG